MASYAYRQDRPNRPHTCIYRGPDGKQKRESFRTKSEARAAVARRTLDEERWRLHGPDERPQEKVPTLGAWADTWMAQYNRAYKTRNKRSSTLKCWILPEFKDTPLNKITPMEIMDLLVRSREKRRSKTTEHAIYATLNLMFEFAVAMGVLDSSPLATVPKPRSSHRRSREIHPFTDEEFHKLLAEMADPYDAIAMAMFFAGLRPSEACALSGRQVQDGWLLVDQAVKGDGSVGGTKTEETRRVPMARILFDRLAGYGRGRMFPGMVERVFRERGFDPAARAVGLTDRVPYDLRHTAASRLLARGATIRQVQAFMGHADLRTTQQYLHLFPGDLGALGDLLD